MSIKLMAFDLDGTLLRDDKTPDPRTVKAVKRAMDAGIHIALASGRDRTGVQFVSDQLGLENGENFYVLVNGQIIYDIQNKEYGLDDVLSPEDGLKIQDVCKRYDVEGIFCCGYDFYSYLSRQGRKAKEERARKTGQPADYGLKTGAEHRNFIDLDIKPYVFSQDINKVCMIQTREFFEDNLDALRQDLKDYDLLMVGPQWLEIMPKGVSKASGLKHVADKLGITMDEVMAFGDAENDIHMLEAAGIGVAMGNAMDTVKEKADLVADTNNNNGIGKVIDELLKVQAEEA